MSVKTFGFAILDNLWFIIDISNVYQIHYSHILTNMQKFREFTGLVTTTTKRIDLHLKTNRTKLCRLNLWAILCHPPQCDYGSRVFKHRYEAKPTALIVGRWHSLGKTISIFNTPIVPLFIFCVRRRPLLAAEGGDLWTGALLPAHYYHNYYYLCIQRHSAEMRFKNLNPSSFAGMSFSFLINYLVPVHHCLVGIVLCGFILSDCWINWQLPWSIVKIGFLFFIILK